MSALKIAIAGVNGRMGRVLVEAVNNHPDTVLSGALEHSGSEVLGLDAGFASGLKTGVAISDVVFKVQGQVALFFDDAVAAGVESVIPAVGMEGVAQERRA